MQVSSSSLNYLIKEASASGDISQEELQELQSALDSLNSMEFSHDARAGIDVKADKDNGRLFVSIGHSDEGDIRRVKQYVFRDKASYCGPHWVKALRDKARGIKQQLFTHVPN